MLALVRLHLTNAQIAARLHLSVRTVESHVSAMLRKLGVADRRELADLAPGLESAPVAGAGMFGLPVPWTTFIGRGREFSMVQAALDDARLVNLTGPGGVGKTRLATAVAAQAGPAFPYGGAFVELVGVRPEFVVQAIATALGVTEQPQRALEEVIYAHLAQHKALLVLDNCEHVLTVVAEFVSRLLTACRAVTVLSTSRERLGVPGERVVIVPALSLASDVTGDAIQSEAELLFLDRARSADADFTEDSSLVRDLCARVDGMPLAIELAAARAGSLGIAGLLAGIDDQLRLLTGGRSADERHRSLRSVLDWSYGLLDDDEQRVLCHLAVFAGGFDLAAVTAVALLDDAGEAADLLGRLVDKSLVVRRQAAGRSRWYLLETVRAYALDRLTASHADAEVRERHLRWAATTAATLQERLEADTDWQADFDVVADDFRAALTTAAPGPGPAGSAHELARRTGHLVFARRFFSEARQHHEHAARRALDAVHAAQDLREAAGVALIELLGDLSFEHMVTAAGLARDAGDGRLQAICLADAVINANRFPGAMAVDIPHAQLTTLMDEAVAAAPSSDPVVTAHLTQALAWNESSEKTSAGRALSEQALAAARAVDDPMLISGALDCVLAAYVGPGHFRDAYPLARERLALVERLPRHVPGAALEIIDVVHMANEHGIAAGELPASLATSRAAQTDDIVNVQLHTALSKVVVPLALSGEFDEAVTAAEQMWSAWLGAAEPTARWMAPSVVATALVYGLRGEQAAYRTWWGRAQRPMGDQDLMTAKNSAGFAAFTQIRLALHQGRIDDAQRLAERTLGGAPEWYVDEGHWYYDAYLWAIAAETAAIAARPDVHEWLATAAPAGVESVWADACLARARGRLGDVAELERSVELWERIGARFERACTLLLLPKRESEGRAELDALGCAPPLT
ncbi:MAG: hypothetical protein QOG22_1588 [Pseudonocardiales bacterium]|nr:hypothetical protein [Pseudonocardiales bacterium]